MNGGRIHGEYPTSLTLSSPTNLGRNRMIPSTSWEAVWAGVAEWFGLSNDQVMAILPNAPNFPNLFTSADLFT